mgnify:CR=1 FL=1
MVADPAAYLEVRILRTDRTKTTSDIIAAIILIITTTYFVSSWSANGTAKIFNIAKRVRHITKATIDLSSCCADISFILHALTSNVQYPKT